MTQSERTELSDSKMLDAAVRLVLEKGSVGTTLKVVGERAGYSRGLASARFGSKEGLFVRLIGIHREAWKQEIATHVKGKSGIDAVLARIDGVEELFRRDPDTIKAIYMVWFESVGRTSSMREALVKFHEETRQQVSTFVAEGIESGDIPTNVDPDAFAIDYFAQIFGFIYQWLVSPDQVDIFRCIDTLRALTKFALTEK